MNETIKKAVFEIIAEQALLSPNELSLDMTFADLGLDSMALVEIIFAIEEHFNISVPFNANEPENSEFDISSLGTMVMALERIISWEEK